MSTTIEDQAQEVKRLTAERLPAPIGRLFADDRDGLRAAGPGAGAVTAGDVLEDFTLPDAVGVDVSLSDLLADGPLVLVFYRGGWCPFCNLTLNHYRAELVPALPTFGARIAAISPQHPDASLSTSEKHGLAFPVLSDAGSRLARRLGIAFEPGPDILAAQRELGLDVREVNAEGTTALPMPTVLVVGPDRRVRFADVRPDYSSRTEVAEILAALGRGA